MDIVTGVIPSPDPDDNKDFTLEEGAGAVGAVTAGGAMAIGPGVGAW